MPSLADLNLSAPVANALLPFVGDKQVGPPEVSVWIEQGRIRMEMEDIGEGYSGDYDETDPDDTPLLRFSFYAKNPGDEDWFSLDEVSHCTQVSADAPWEVQLACACQIFDQVAPELSMQSDEEVDETLGRKGRRAAESASWTSSDQGMEELLAALQARDLAQGLPDTQPATRAPRF